MIKTYHGTCHCKAVAFETDLDLSLETKRCNCTFCRKTRNWSAQTSMEHFRMSTGADKLGQYDSTGEAIIVHCFCSICGVRLFSKGNIPEMGGAFVSVALATLDDPSDAELVAAPVVWCDGLHDNWWNPPAEVRHL